MNKLFALTIVLILLVYQTIEISARDSNQTNSLSGLYIFGAPYPKDAAGESYFLFEQQEEGVAISWNTGESVYYFSRMKIKAKKYKKMIVYKIYDQDNILEFVIKKIGRNKIIYKGETYYYRPDLYEIYKKF